MKTLTTNKLTICCGDLSKFHYDRFDFYESNGFVTIIPEVCYRIEEEFEKQGWEKHNTIIHLHTPEDFHTPQQMRLLARRVGEVINLGYKILITTNNDYLLHELNTLITLYWKSNNNIPSNELELEDNPTVVDKICQEYQYNSKQFLNPNDVIAYDYIKRTKQCKMDNYGIEIPSIDNTIAEVNKIMDLLIFE